MTFAVIAGTIGIVLVTVAIGAVIERKVGPKDNFRVEVTRRPPAGDTPATAIRAHGDQLAKLRTTQRCPECRIAMESGSDERVRYGGGELLLVRVSCGKCGRARTLYVDDRG